MDNLNLNKHISGQFNAELEHIRTQVLTMGGLVEQQLTDAITAMHNQDGELAKRVIEGDGAGPDSVCYHLYRAGAVETDDHASGQE